VDRIKAPIPLELKRFGLASTLERIESELGDVALRPDCPPSPDNGVIADSSGPVHEAGQLAARLALTPGVVDHGLFPAGMVSAVLIGRGDSVERV
jgi:ribose 5-phosphate isomerase A